MFRTAWPSSPQLECQHLRCCLAAANPGRAKADIGAAALTQIHEMIAVLLDIP